MYEGSGHTCLHDLGHLHAVCDFTLEERVYAIDTYTVLLVLPLYPKIKRKS